MKKLALLVLALGLFAVSCGAKAEEAKQFLDLHRKWQVFPATFILYYFYLKKTVKRNNF